MKKSSTAGKSGLGNTQAGKRKVEGYDQGVSRADAQSRLLASGVAGGTGRSIVSGTGFRSSEIKDNFNHNVERLKGQGAKQVEDEYIKALQEEIKILEYQMKILKDKEMEQQAAVSQIDKFFSDGVPLNDNILALKTQYQSKKSDDEKHLDGLKKAVMQHDKDASDLDSEIKAYVTNKGRIDKEKDKTEEELQKYIDE